MTIVTGTWSLALGCGGISYRCSGPDLLPVPDQLVFHADGTMEQFRGGVRVATGTFTITPDTTDSLRSGTATLRPGLETADETLALTFSIEGQLMLAEPCCDRLTYSFNRREGPD